MSTNREYARAYMHERYVKDFAFRQAKLEYNRGRYVSKRITKDCSECGVRFKPAEPDDCKCHSCTTPVALVAKRPRGRPRKVVDPI